MNEQREVWISASKAASRASMRKEEMLQLLANGRIPAIKTDKGRWQVPVLAFDNWLGNREAALNHRAADEARARREAIQGDAMDSPASPGIERGAPNDRTEGEV